MVNRHVQGKANPSQQTSTAMISKCKESRQPSAVVRRRYGLMAVFPLVKPRSISTLRSNFPTEPARGHTMGTPEDSPRMGCTHLNSRWRVLIFRVQLMSLEYNRQVSSMMSFGSRCTLLPSSDENANRKNKKHTQRKKQRAKRTLNHSRCTGTSR